MRYPARIALGTAAVLGIGVAGWIFVHADRVSRLEPTTSGAVGTDSTGAAKNAMLTQKSSARETQRLNLTEVSETFRHSTLLTAIRGAGFYCDDVVSSYESVAGVWIANCRDRRGYKILVGEPETMRVEPVPLFVDGLPSKIPE